MVLAKLGVLFLNTTVLSMTTNPFSPLQSKERQWYLNTAEAVERIQNHTSNVSNPLGTLKCVSVNDYIQSCLTHFSACYCFYRHWEDFFFLQQPTFWFSLGNLCTVQQPRNMTIIIIVFKYRSEPAQRAAMKPKFRQSFETKTSMQSVPLTRGVHPWPRKTRGFSPAKVCSGLWNCLNCLHTD